MSTQSNSFSVVTETLADIEAKVAASATTINQIRQAILDKGVSVTADTTLAELPNKIREICDTDPPLTETEKTAIISYILAPAEVETVAESEV